MAPALAPAPSAEERRANATYEALLWALSRPGEPRRLPGQGAAWIVEALVDHECRVHVTDLSLLPALDRTGATPAPLSDADHVFLGILADAAPLREIAVGSDLQPDDGATVVVAATLGVGPRLRLTGPGVDGAREVSVGGLPAGFWRERERVIRYPMGFDLFLLDGDRVMGVPRSTHVEAL